MLYRSLSFPFPFLKEGEREVRLLRKEAACGLPFIRDFGTTLVRLLNFLVVYDEIASGLAVVTVRWQVKLSAPKARHI